MSWKAFPEHDWDPCKQMSAPLWMDKMSIHTKLREITTAEIILNITYSITYKSRGDIDITMVKRNNFLSPRQNNWRIGPKLPLPSLSDHHFPGWAFRRLPAHTQVTHREGNFIGRPPLYKVSELMEIWGSLNSKEKHWHILANYY